MKENAIVSILLVVVIVAIIGFLGIGVVMVFDEDSGGENPADATSPPFIIRTPGNEIDDNTNQIIWQDGIESGASDGVGAIGDTIEELFSTTKAYNKLSEKKNQGNFELPISGAMGFNACKVNVYESKSLTGDPICTLAQGRPFIIKSEEGNVWQIEAGLANSKIKGYISNKNCFINLPDIIPSIVYNITNSNSSLFASTGKPLPGITGERLFDYYIFSTRYGTNEYVVPILYTMAKKIYKAQQSALKDGNTLVIYEAYRPADAQKKVAKALQDLCNSDPQVRKAVSNPPWSLTWFISTGTSNHQRGCAIDVSLARVDEAKIKICGNANYVKVTRCSEYQMQSEMHELSVQAASMTKPINSGSKDAWKSAEISSLMTDSSIRLRKYCTDSGMTPLASEWWHFNDLDAKNEIGNSFSLEYDFRCCASVPVE